MKKTFSLITIVLLFSVFIPTTSADGFIHIYDQDMWNLFNEEQQFCAINYKEGFQHMILTVDTGEELRGEKAVWIFPVPAKPGDITINIIKGFPVLFGYNVEDKAKESISGAFISMRIACILPYPLVLFMRGLLLRIMGRVASSESWLGGSVEDVTIHKRLEKMGLTTELVSAVDGMSLSNYLIDKGINLEDASQSILDEYIGQEYSFVISWISDIEKFKLEQKQSDYGGLRGNTIGVYTTFPTEKIYYPLKPTSVYGNRRIPVAIYVMDYVKPELYKEIKKDTEVDYFFEKSYTPQEELKDFFNGQDKIENLKYTKIKINSPSKFLTQDLWARVSTPIKLKIANFMVKIHLWLELLIFVVCSCLASLFSASIIFRKDSPSLSKFMIFGLSNLITLFGVLALAYKYAIDKKFTQIKEIAEPKVGAGKVVKGSLLVGLIISILLLLFMITAQIMSGWSFGKIISDIKYVVFLLPFIYGNSCLLIAPFVWGYCKNRKIMKFIILFAVSFIILNIVSQLFLTLII